MKIAATFPLLVGATAFVLPETELFSGLEIQTHKADRKPAYEATQNWWDELPSKATVVSAAEEAFDYLSSHIEHAIAAGKESFNKKVDHLLAEEELELDDFAEDDEQDDSDHPKHPKHVHGPGHGHSPGHGHRPRTSNLTIYQLIQKSKYSTKFAKIVDEFESVVDVLNSTEANYTVFVPTDAAFEHLPHHGDDGKKPPKEFIEAWLKYHIGLGLYPAIRILHTHTLPTALNESYLGNHPQRLRTRFGFGGVRVNFYSKVVRANIPAKNGVIHAVNAPLFPPPMVGRIISLFPQRFSTLLLAYEKTDFVKYIHGVPLAGSTVFAPTNQAFTRLGPRVNAFLFNTETGKKYLNAILKYHIVANSTLYSDALYQTKGATKVDVSASEHFHIDLPTLLDDKSVAIDVARWGSWINLKVNGYIPVEVQDGIAKNGVIQVVGRVLIPPHKHKTGGGPGDEVDGEMEIEELKERLRDYVEDDGHEENRMGDL